MLFNSSIGIDISDHQINIVYLKGSFKGVKLAAASTCPLDAGKSRHDRQSDIVGFIKGFIRKETITAADIFIGISGDHSMMREIEFPLAVKENLRTTLAYEIEKYIPIAASDVYFDYHIIAESKDEEKLKNLFEEGEAIKENMDEEEAQVWQKDFEAGKVELGINGFDKHRPVYFISVGPRDPGADLEISHVFLQVILWYQVGIPAVTY